MAIAKPASNSSSPFLSVLAVILLAAIAGVAIELHPFVHPREAGSTIHFVFLAVLALYLGWVIYAGWKGRDLWAADSSISPGQFMTVGYAAFTVHTLAFDVASYFMFQGDRGVPKYAYLSNAWMLLGYLWIALPLFLAFRRTTLKVSWRYHALLGSLLFGFQACLGLIKAITYALALIVDPSYYSESWEFGVMAIPSGVANLLLYGWFVVLFVFYVRDYFQKTRYRWLHYVPLLVVIVIIALGTIAILQFSGGQQSEVFWQD